MMMPPEGMFESFLLCALIAAVTRWGTAVAIGLSAPIAGLAVAVSISRVDVEDSDLTTTETVAAMGFWAMGPLAAVVFGLYLRYMEVKREKSIAIAKQTQRLDLAHDLHDYVAHDVSAMIAQAQTALLFVDDTDQVRAHLQRIEAAGQAAMSSMDRTVRVLRAGHTIADSLHVEVPGLSQVPDIVERFSSSTEAQVTLTIDPAVVDGIPRELESTACRVIVESLTNVHRHAALSSEISISMTMADSHFDVTVTNTISGHTGSGTGRRSGLGLSGLRERVEALGGTFSAGIQAQRWRVHARMPAVAEKGAVDDDPSSRGR